MGAENFHPVPRLSDLFVQSPCDECRLSCSRGAHGLHNQIEKRGRQANSEAVTSKTQ